MTPIVIRKFVCQSWGVEKMLTEAFELSHNECGAAGRGEKSAEQIKRREGSSTKE